MLKGRPGLVQAVPERWCEFPVDGWCLNSSRQFQIMNCMICVLLSCQDGCRSVSLQQRMNNPTQLKEPMLLHRRRYTIMTSDFDLSIDQGSDWGELWKQSKLLILNLTHRSGKRQHLSYRLSEITCYPKRSITDRERFLFLRELACGLGGSCMPCFSGSVTHSWAVVWAPKLHVNMTSASTTCWLWVSQQFWCYGSRFGFFCLKGILVPQKAPARGACSAWVTLPLGLLLYCAWTKKTSNATKSEIEYFTLVTFSLYMGTLNEARGKKQEYQADWK